MELEKIIITILGFGLIGTIWWFFFGKKEKNPQSNSGGDGNNINISVNGGYSPSVIKVKSGIETTLKIKRTDQNSCLEEIILPDFKISKYLPLNETVEIKVKGNLPGEFPFHCGMNMFHGKIVVD
jgi:plastocyanin domain-containing protein